MSDVLKAMGRNSDATMKFIEKVRELRNLGVIVATNIIIDYVVDGKLSATTTGSSWKRILTITCGTRIGMVNGTEKSQKKDLTNT